jgi:DNA-binding CsgD family transcriptional regulator
VYTVIGDLVGSRSVPDRTAAQQALGDALAVVNASLPVEQAFEPTVGDEYQGACATLSGAVLAALVTRLTLLPVVDARCGIGFGEVTVHDATRRPLLQDGPGWWAARDAIESLDGRRDTTRTWFAGPGREVVNAFLVCRDQIIDRLNDRGLRILRLALLGHPQKDIAELEGIWPSAVSQQFTRNIGSVVESMRLLAQADPSPERQLGAPPDPGPVP